MRYCLWLATLGLLTLNTASATEWFWGNRNEAAEYQIIPDPDDCTECDRDFAEWKTWIDLLAPRRDREKTAVEFVKTLTSFANDPEATWHTRDQPVASLLEPEAAHLLSLDITDAPVWLQGVYFHERDQVFITAISDENVTKYREFSSGAGLLRYLDRPLFNAYVFSESS